MSDLFASLCDQGFAENTSGMIAFSLKHPQCAWCLKERGEEPGNGSHGICPAHYSQQIRRERRIKNQRSE